MHMVYSLLPAILLLLFAVQPPPANAQGQGVCPSGEQPVASSVAPPSGTTGDDPRESTNYTISGEILDQVDTIEVQSGLQTTIIARNSTSIQFHIQDANLRRREIVNATILLIPRNLNCLTANITVMLFALLDIRFEGENSAQPGTVVLIGSGTRTCVPGECGDNSTTFDVVVGGITLERLNTDNTTFKYAGRLPNFVEDSTTGAEVTVVTQYQEFRLISFFTIDLRQPDPISVMPNIGQRGTYVSIQSLNLLGFGHSVEISRVRLGSTDADINGFSITQLQVRARSGNPGTGSISINTTDTFDGVRFDGPYIYLENGWTQLNDGSITSIIPPAAQLGRSILLCGSDLLGNGTSISMILHGLNTLLQLQPSPLPSTPPQPGSECLEVQVPDAVNSTSESTVVIMSNTGALVSSTSNFAVSGIESVIPNGGQAGTIVTIRGRALLSGYPTAVPQVFLSNVIATLLQQSNSEIVVQAGTPPTLNPRVINTTTGATEPPPQIIGIMGSVSIVVVDNSVRFNVSNDTGWQYEELGFIDTVLPSFGQFRTLITINGNNLLAYGRSLTHATIGGVNATILDGASNSVVQLIVPDASTTDDVDIILFSDTGANVRGSRIFQYREKGVVSAALPSQGQNGTFVTIVGTNLFGHGGNITSVMFGDVPAVIDYSLSNNTRIEVRVQANDNTVDTAVPIRIVADTSALVVSSSPIWTFLVQGEISSNQPLQGQVGTVIVITGTNLLGGGNLITEIFLDGVSASITSSSSTSVTVVMGDLLTQRAGFFSGEVYIMSDTGAVVSGGTYTHQASGTITSFSPTQGRRGTIITIQGSNVLGFGTAISGVQIAGVLGTVVSFSSTTVVAAAGMGARNQTGPIVLQIDTGAIIVSTTNFIFDEPGVVSSVTPTQGAEGTGVSVSGSGLIPNNVLLTSVTVGGVPVSRVVTASNQEVSIIVGPAPFNNSDRAMILINASDGSFVGGIFFSFITLTISLNGLSQGQEGTAIEINLPNTAQFEPNSNLRATVDNLAASITTINVAERRIIVSVPRARRLGTFTADVAVEGSNGVIARLRDGFMYLAEGLICTVDPVTGQTGTMITLQGENLLGGGSSIASASVVGQPAVVIQFSDVMVVLQLMQSRLEGMDSYPLQGDIILTADTGAVVRRLNTFSLVEPGSITQVSPSVGQNGTTVDIIGTNLLQGNLNVISVTLAGVPAVLMGIPTHTLVSVQATPSPATQVLSVVITLSSGASISSGGVATFQYLTPGRINTVSPNSGAVGTRLTISGSNLLQGGSTARMVLLGGFPAIIDGTPSTTSIDVIAQVGMPGLSGDVVIVSDTGSTLTGATSVFIYEAVGTITRVSPDIGQQGFEVTITGESLLGLAVTRFSTCLLAGVPAAIVVGRFNSTSVVCRAGANPFSRMNISGPVELATETGVMLNSGPNIMFTYYAAYIGSISPMWGNNGTEVTIRGLNLFNSPNGSFLLTRVLFGSVEATVDSSSANEVRVRVGFSNVPTTNNDVRIESSSGSFLVLANSWNYTSPRAIRALEPRNGFPGDTITLYGDNLVPVGVSAVRVVIGQTEAFNIQLINASTIQFRVGIYQNSDFPQRDLPVQIVYPSGETTSSTTVLFQYNATIENVTSVSPRAGGGGSVVVISGANLPNSTDSIRAVTLANVPAVVLSAGASEIVVEAGVPPSGVRGQVSIETITGRVLGLAGEVWEYYPSITNSDVSPVTGQNGTTVTIDLSRITNLPSVVGVSLTNVPAIQVTVTSSGMLTARAGQSTDTPIGDVTIDLAGGIIVEISNAWSYQAPVSITNVSPSSGYFNTLVTIQGSEFQVNAVTVTAVYLAGIETTIEFQSNTMLRVRISQDNPSDSDLDGPISIITDSGSFYSSEREVNFTYIGVQIRSVSPQSGTRGTLVTLTGVGLLAGGANITSATLAGVPATVQSSNSTMVSFTAGTLASSSNLGSIEYMVDTGARVQMPRSWRYIEPGEITFVTPSAGAMGTTVSIGGNNLLGGGTRVTSVVLNSRETTNILESFENFVQVTAEGTAGPLQAGNIQVISDTQAITESVSPVQFEYLEPGTISSITPSQGQNGTFVTITGQRFDNGEGVARVFIAGVEAAIRNNQGSTITVEAGRPTDSGSFEGPVLVQSSINTTSISAQNFTYLTEGIIFSVVPRQGRNGTVVSIEGENLLGGGAALESVILAGESADIINQTAGVASTVFVRAPLGFNTSNTGDVILVSDTNAHVRRVDGWTYVQRGTVSSVTPNQGQYGTHVIISGQNLLSGGCGIGTARFSDVTFEVVSVTDTTVMAIVGEPENPIEFTSESISITADLGGVLYVAYNWSFLNQSAIMNLNPPSGLSQEMVTINGTNLLGGGTVISSVRVAGIVGTVVMSSNNEVVIMTGTNELGALRRGDLILESDTGALTVATWTYEEECPVGMFGMADSCAPCSDQCQRCDGPTELNCTLCDNFNIYLDENSLFCVEKCPSVSTLDNVCVNACETNQYEQIDTLQNLTFCYNCSDLCDPNLGCSGPSPSQCPGCLFFRDANQTCVENCSSDSFFANGTRDCIPCHPQCSGGCYGPSEFECNGCANLRVNPNTFRIDTSPLFNDVCRETCPSLFFLDPLSNSDFCQSCDSSCSIGCNGPTPFDCIECRNVSFVYPNGTRKCLNFCSPNHYSDERNICMPCSDLCLPGEGCTGANPSDCNVCSLAHAPDLSCVRECIDSTYFIRNATRTCERCADACGSGGCTEAGPQNCIRQGSFAAGPGTTAFVIIVVFILIAVIVVLVTVVVLLYRRRGSSIKYRLPKIFSIGKESRKTSEEMARYTKSSQVQDIPLASIEEKKTMANPLFLEEGADACYPDEDDVLYMDAENEKSLLPNKNNVVSTSQDLYTDMDYPPSRSVTASQDMLYTDMEPGLIPARPPKPTELASKEPVAPPKDLGPEKDDIPPIPEKTQKPPPPPPEVEASSGELYTDMQGGITEVFINPVADDVYDDVLAPSPPPTLSPMETLTYKQDEKLLGPDTTYEDTESALASMEQFRKSFGAGSKNTTNYVPQEPSKKPIGKQQSAPALPSQPIPKKRPSSTSTTPLPPTPLQKSLSSTSFPTSISPTSTLTRPGSIISDRGGIPEEESLYDDIAGVQPLVKQTPAPPAKQKGQQKPKTKKK